MVCFRCRESRMKPTADKCYFIWRAFSTAKGQSAAYAGALRHHLEDYADVMETVEIRRGDRLTRNLRQH